MLDRGHVVRRGSLQDGNGRRDHARVRTGHPAVDLDRAEVRRRAALRPAEVDVRNAFDSGPRGSGLGLGGDL